MPRDIKGDWPTDIFTQQKARFNGTLGPRLETDIKPLQDKISAQKHPWNILSGLALIGGGAGTFGLTQLYEQAIIPGLVATGLSFFSANSVARKKNKTLRAAKSDLSHYMQDAIGLNISNVSHTHQSVLQTFSQAGFLGRYDRMHYLVGLNPKTENHPQSIGTKLTRRETETYTDSKGNVRQRTRIVTVFEGLMLEMDIADFDTDNRTLITSRRMYRFSGPFDRIKNNKRHKMDKIKTASLEFNKYYKVRTDDSTLGHLFLDPERVMRFNNLYADLRQALGTKRVAISFLITQGRAWIAIETDGLPNMDGFSNDPERLDKHVGKIIGQATLPHIIAEHLEWPSPMPYAWQGYVLDNE